jgi:hypothetical protein
MKAWLLSWALTTSCRCQDVFAAKGMTTAHCAGRNRLVTAGVGAASGKSRLRGIGLLD